MWAYSQGGKIRDFPDVQWLGLGTFTAMGQGSIPGQGTKIPQAARRDQKKKKGGKIHLSPTFGQRLAWP